jgi:ribosomal protein S18 acetylase RimI-like enzyme
MSNAKKGQVTVRRMVRDDVHDVLALERVAAGPGGSVINFGDMAAANPGTAPDLSFVAEVEGKIIGFSVNRSMFLMVPLTEVCIIHAIFVHPDYQQRGIGSRLIRALLNHCQDEGIATVRALIPRDSKELQALFKRQGFRRSHVINYDKTFQS